MKVFQTDNFKKSLNKRYLHNKKFLQVIIYKIQLFINNPNDQKLRTHALTGTKKGYYSFSVTGDIRVIFYIFEENAYLVDIGTHNQVY